MNELSVGQENGIVMLVLSNDDDALVIPVGHEEARGFGEAIIQAADTASLTIDQELQDILNG